MSAQLDTPGRIAPAEGADGGGPAAGAGRGQAPPPPPSLSNMSADALRQQMTALRRQQRQVRRQAAADRVRAVHRSWWIAAGVIGGLAATAVGCQRVQTAQDRTTIALAELATAPRESATTVPQPVVVDGIPNPLDALALTSQARWLIGIDGNGALLPARSSAVIAELIKGTDVCGLFVSLDDKAAISVGRTPKPGSVPLVSCAATSTTVAR